MAYSPAARPVLENLTLDVATGSFVAILGRSGSGKSTLLNLLGAMDRPLSGVLEVAGCDLCRADERTQTIFRRRQLGFVFQDFNLVPVLDVRHNLALPLALNDIDAPARVDSLLTELGLAHLERRYPGELSGGEQQRVAIGRALVHRPRLVLADEPTGNLDLETSGTVLTLFRGLIRRHGATVVMATHSLEAARYADRVLRLVDGHLVEGA
ncbi:MAG: ABC transporter ATP-binding protein [Gammaproteobacteria bacterium]